VNTVVAAVLSGNSVVIKHSDRTPKCADHFADAFRSVPNAPPHLVQAIHVTHPILSRLLGDENIAHVSFTGSVEGGRAVYQKAAHRFIDVGLELGGKDPAYVCEDADLRSAIDNVVDGAMYNAGQSCCSVERVYVHSSIYKPFVEGATELVKGYVLGNPMDVNTTMGPIAQPQHPSALQQRVDDAKSKGAKLLVGGTVTKDKLGFGRFYSPTVLVDCTHEMKVMTEENFGPILSIAEVKDDATAIQMMNDSNYGLTASVWTKDSARATSILKQINAGTVFMNRCDTLDPFFALVWP